MTPRSRNIINAVGVVIVLATITIIAVVKIQRARATEYRTFASPDGAYELVVYRIPPLVASMPGQAGDASGFITLYDSSKHVLYRTDVEIVSSIDRIDWDVNQVQIRGIAVWKLPRD